MQETRVWFLGREDPLEEEMVTQSSMLAWRSPWTEEPGRLQFVGSQSQTWLIMHRCSLVYLAPLIQHDLKFIYKMCNVKKKVTRPGIQLEKGQMGQARSRDGGTVTSSSSESSAFIMFSPPHFPFCSRISPRTPPTTLQQSSAIFLKNYHGKAFLIRTGLGHFRIIVSAWILEG